jgi:hypothetical protein
MDMKDKETFHVRVKSAKKIHGNQLIKLNGMKFGYYRVLKVDRTRSSAVNKDIDMANAYWLCICERCGCKVSVRSDSLRFGISRMCGSCSYEDRANFRMATQLLAMELAFKNIEIVDKPTKAMRKQKIKMRKLPPGTMIKIRVTNTYDGAKGIRKVCDLRDTGMKIGEIAELLNLTKDQVLEELKKRHQS